MFLAPVLYAVHAVLTGTAMVMMHWLEVRLGFGFSAGLFDYVLNFRLAHKPLWLVPVGAAYFALYYGLFRYAIAKFDLRTPGREAEAAGGIEAGTGAEIATGVVSVSSAGTAIGTASAGPPADFVTALGGPGNLTSVDACTTRLRLEVRDQARVDEAALKRLGAHGLVRPSATALQVVLGPIADQVAEQIRRQLRAGVLAGPPAASTPVTAAVRAASVATEPVTRAVAAPPSTEVASTAIAPTSASKSPAAAMLRALGGAGNIVEISVASTRLRIRVRDDSAVDAARVIALAPRGGVRAAPQLWHVVVGPDVERLAAELHSRIAR
jgi:PTS system N-acetylglucosamine-specific IIC component